MMSKKPTYEELEQRVQLVEAEKRLSESEERFRQLVECSPISVMMLQNGKYTYGNPASAVLLGYESPGDIVGIDALQTIAPEFHASLRERMKRIQAGGFNEPMEIKIIKPSGEYVWTRSTSVSLTIDEEPTAVIFGQDITDSRKAAIEIQKSRQRHQAIIKTAMDGYWLTDIKGYLIEVNDAYCKLSGYSEAELLHMHISDLEAVENPERVAQHMQRIIHEGADRFESRHRRKNGTVFDVEVSVQYRPDEGGQCVCFLRDITEQKQSRERIVDALTWYQEIFEGSRDAIFISDENAKFISVNSAACALTGYDRHALLRMCILDFIDGMDLDDYNRYHARILGGEPMLGEAKIRLKTGEKVDVEFSNKRIDVAGKTYMHTVARDISDRKRSSEQIEALNQRLTIATESAGIGVWDFDIKNDILYWDDWMYRIYGIDPNDFNGAYDAWKSGVHPQDLSRADAEVQKAINQGMPFDTSFRIVRPDGEIRHVKAYGCVTRNLHGAPVKMTGVNIDTTEQKQFETALKESETKFRTLVDQAPAALFLHDMDGNIADVNKAALDGYGYTVKQLLQMKAEDIDPDYIALEDKGKFWEELQKKTRIDFEARHRRSDGSLFPVRVSLTPITLNGRRHVFALAVDMTEYKEAQEKIISSQERFRTVFNQAAVGVAIVSKEGFFLELNDKLCKIIGYTRDELTKMTFRDITHPADLALDENCVQKVIAGEMDAYEIEKRYIHKQGHPIWIRLFSNVVRNAAGDIKFALAIVTDISKQKAAEEERRKLLDRLNHAQRMESIGNLAGGIAHDFNNILFPIVGMSELLMEDLPGNSLAWENAEEIFKAGNRGKDLVRQILAFSRQSEHKLMPTRIQNVLKEVIKLARSSIPSYIEINHDVQSDCGLVMADQTQMHQVAMNIITNAYHAVDATGGNISITLRESALDGSASKDMDLRPGKYAVLSISDTGHGMSSDLIKKIFDPYFTTKEKGRGTGLGLAVVHGIVKEHHGDIRVKSEISKGTTFDIYIPLVERSAASAMVKIGEAYPTGNESILLVDDETPIAKLEKMMLERLGYQVTMRINSMETLNVFKAKPKSFDLVLTDMNMPNMTGDQLAKEIKAIRPDIPIILCTGFSERIRAQKTEHVELAGIIMKPIVKAELAKIVRKVLDEAPKKDQE